MGFSKLSFYEFLYCTYCIYYDEYDICCHKKNFGTIIDSKVDLCKELKLFKENKKYNKKTDVN